MAGELEMIEAVYDDDAARARQRTQAAAGGKARADSLTLTERHNIAKKAAEARWGKTVKVASHAGSVSIGGREFDCAVLEDGSRVINQSTLLSALDRTPKAKGSDAGPVLFAQNLMPYVDDDLRRTLANPVVYASKSGGRANGYPAEILPQVCEVYLNARQDNRLTKNQESAAKAAEVLVRGLARIGIFALVDEATGYQESRDRRELQLILEQYVRAELRPWMKTFPDDFFAEVFRIHGWAYKPKSSARPGVVGHFINKYIYEQLPPGVMEELQRLNPSNGKGRRAHKHHQHLTAGTGNQALDHQIVTVTTLMRVADSKRSFIDLFERVHPPTQPQLPLVIEVDDDI